MSQLDQLTQPPIQPIYSQSEPSQAIDLGTFPAQLTLREKIYQEAATVRMRFVPDDRLSFNIPAQGQLPLFGFFLDDNWDGKLTLIDRFISFEVFCSSINDDGVTFLPNTSGVTASPPSQAITTAKFHLFNFPDFFGQQDYSLIWGEGSMQSFKWCGRVILRADGWMITIAATDKTDELCKALEQQGGFLITHVGKIEREDGSTFSSEQLEDLLQCTRYFLSFALGRWAGVALPVGFDESGKKVFEQWGLPMVAAGAWEGSCSWFDKKHGQLLSQVFPGFMNLWKNEVWNRALKSAIYWYLGACERGTGIGVDTGLILAQTALELLAWSYCVEDRKMVSQKAFEPRGLSAADKLRILASALDIPLEIPSTLCALHARPGEKWQDSMDAITAIRNAIVHPKTKKQLPDGAYYEGWKLSLWYIDMVLLHLCGHVGQYGNRLVNRWVGKVETVPWSQVKQSADSP